jgi:hypothetical protein
VHVQPVDLGPPLAADGVVPPPAQPAAQLLDDLAELVDDLADPRVTLEMVVSSLRMKSLIFEIAL